MAEGEGILGRQCLIVARVYGREFNDICRKTFCQGISSALVTCWAKRAFQVPGVKGAGEIYDMGIYDKCR